MELVCGSRRVGGEPGDLSNEESMMQTLFVSPSSLQGKIVFKNILSTRQSSIIQFCLTSFLKPETEGWFVLLEVKSHLFGQQNRWLLVHLSSPGCWGKMQNPLLDCLIIVLPCCCLNVKRIKHIISSLTHT